jgi:hypothetical protein
LTDRLVVIKEWSGKYAINEAYRPIAEGLVKKYPELRHIAPAAIIFIDNTEGSGKSRDKYKSAQTGKLPEKWSDVIHQLTGRRFDYYIEFFKRNIEQMSREQIVALVYHELRHIGPDGEIIHHDIEDWANMHYKLGANWASTRATIPDLLADGVDWDSITGPRLFDEPGDERKLKAVK